MHQHILRSGRDQLADGGTHHQSRELSRALPQKDPRGGQILAPGRIHQNRLEFQPIRRSANLTLLQTSSCNC